MFYHQCRPGQLVSLCSKVKTVFRIHPVVNRNPFPCGKTVEAWLWLIYLHLVWSPKCIELYLYSIHVFMACRSTWDVINLTFTVLWTPEFNVKWEMVRWLQLISWENYERKLLLFFMFVGFILLRYIIRIPLKYNRNRNWIFVVILFCPFTNTSLF
jgi:hypothetical protein